MYLLYLSFCPVQLQSSAGLNSGLYKQQHGQTTTPGATFSPFCEKCVDSLTFPAIKQYREDARNGACGLSSLSESTRTSDHLQMSYHRHHILLSYFKSLSVSPVWGLNSVEPCPALYNTLFTTNTKGSIRYLLEIG